MGIGAFICRVPSARAEQFVLLDATFDYTWQDAQNSKPSLSHFYVNEGNFLNKARPKDWTSPVDYRNGKLHVRTEVFVKPPGDQQVGWTLCYIPYSGGYGCADTTYYKGTGVFDRETSMTDFWQNEEINWAQGVKQMDLIYAIDDSGSGHITNHPEVKDLVTPTRVRITMVQVSAGSTYDPSPFNNGAGGAGGSTSGGAGGSTSGGAGGAGLAGMGGALVGGAAASGVSGGGYGGLLGMGGTSGASSTSGGSSAAAGSAGAPASGGAAGTATVLGGAGATGAAAPNTAEPSGGSDGGCSMAGARSSTLVGASWFGLGLALWGARRRRQRRPAS
jgi:hypothetical protein